MDVKKYDCTKTLDYVHEFHRMCNTVNPSGDLSKCDNCSLDSETCYVVEDISEERVMLIQDWSDEHPEKMRKEVFKNLLYENNFSDVYKNMLPEDGINCGYPICMYDSCDNCKKYWDEVV